MQITLDSNPSDAPGCVKVTAEDGRDVLFQTDWDWPAVASVFGWSVKKFQKDQEENCEHKGTDGTVKCQDCGATPGEFIAAAREWLDDNDGAEAEDPGYFE